MSENKDNDKKNENEQKEEGCQFIVIDDDEKEDDKNNENDNIKSNFDNSNGCNNGCNNNKNNSNFNNENEDVGLFESFFNEIKEGVIQYSQSMIEKKKLEENPLGFQIINKDNLKNDKDEWEII